MAEAYECDRCGSLCSGSPTTSVRVGPGLSRVRDPERPAYHEPRDIKLVDLCRACQNDLEKWYATAGGDRSDVQHRGVLPEGDADE